MDEVITSKYSLEPVAPEQLGSNAENASCQGGD